MKECKEKTETTTMEGIRKRGRTCKRRRDEVQEDLNITGIKSRKEIAETVKGMGGDSIRSEDP
jgi:hypothetical protein